MNAAEIDDFWIPGARKKNCIFCGEKANSKEHFWGAWLQRSLIRLDAGKLQSKHEMDTFVDGRRVMVKGPFANVNPLLNMTLKVVCKKCNNGWMSGIQVDVKPILTSLFKEQSLTIDDNGKFALLNWLVLKHFLLQAASPMAGLKQVSEELENKVKRKLIRERTEFFRTRQYPAKLKVWLIRCLDNTLIAQNSFSFFAGAQSRNFEASRLSEADLAQCAMLHIGPTCFVLAELPEIIDYRGVFQGLNVYDLTSKRPIQCHPVFHDQWLVERQIISYFNLHGGAFRYNF